MFFYVFELYENWAEVQNLKEFTFCRNNGACLPDHRQCGCHIDSLVIHNGEDQGEARSQCQASH